MEKIKRIMFILIMSIFCISSLGSCGYKRSVIFDFEDLKDRVASVELLHLNDGERMYDYDRLYILQEDELLEFLQGYCALPFVKFYPPKTPSGYAVMLIYIDGCYDVVSANGGTKFDARGEKIGHAPAVNAREEYRKLLSKYIEVNTENRYW